MIDNCYSFTELKEKFGWNTSVQEIERQITYARRRGITIEKAFKKGPTYFRIIDADTYPNEIWKDHPNGDLGIEISSLGRVKDKVSKAFIGYQNIDGYVVITKHSIRYQVHRLVLETFAPIENSENFYVDHIDGKRNNNCLDNLRWVKATENLMFRNEKWQELSEIYQNLLLKYGYDKLKNKLLTLLEEKTIDK